jgi:hypothetical protein
MQEKNRRDMDRMVYMAFARPLKREWNTVEQYGETRVGRISVGDCKIHSTNGVEKDQGGRSDPSA